MAQAKARANFEEQTELLNVLRGRLREGALIGLAFTSVLFLLALLSFDTQDPGWSYTGGNAEIANLIGATGAWVADVVLFVFGFAGYLLPMLMMWQAWSVFLTKQAGTWIGWAIASFRGAGLLVLFTAICGLASLHFYTSGDYLPAGSGGVFGHLAHDVLVPAFSYVGSTLVLSAFGLIGFTVAFDVSWPVVFDRIGGFVLGLVARIQGYATRVRSARSTQRERKAAEQIRRDTLETQIKRQEGKPQPAIRTELPPVEKSERANRERQGKLFDVVAAGELPELRLLNASDPSEQRGYSTDDLEAMSRLLELKLRDYNVEAEVVAVFPGPVITRFEIQPAAGIKVSKIAGLVKDLARSLAVVSVRVVEVIPGKSVVGIEIPNLDRQMVRLSDVLASKAYDTSASPLSLALGHDISGQPIVVDLARMPHLLAAGTTGSGKSVGLNAMILSLLFKASPEEVRLIMVDPKMLELAIYEGIPHLLTPVVTDMKEAANALRWCVGEMERRYRLMAALGVRNMAGYNRKVREAVAAGEPLLDPLCPPDAEAETLEVLPYIVVIIDEFADMMMIVGKKVEELIARIAQKARAAGIHLVLATQRPSVDVITGLIKANIPTRIAFQVSSKVDSRTILDQGGAEQLLGHGDMLYLPPGSPLPARVHGAFVDDDEVHRVVASWKALGEPNYLDEILVNRTDADILPGSAGVASDDDGEEADELYDQAVEFVTESRRASISAVQRKLRIGYNRAARLIETMEKAGLVSEMNSNGSREVLANAQSE
mgnify:CR=1 FL=1